MTLGGMIVVGGGHAGARACRSIRQGGYSGTLTLVAEDGGELPIERPPLSKWDREGIDLVPIMPADHWADLNVNILSQSVVALDRDRKLLRLNSQEQLSYDKLLLATGARPRQLPIKGADELGVQLLRSEADASAIRNIALKAQSAVIFGGGFIGLELAASLRKLDIDVHVLEMTDRLLARAVSAPIAQIVQDLHVSNGVRFSFGVSIEKLSQSDGQSRVHLTDGTHFDADLLIAGIGSIPNTELARSAGLDVSNGIVVDECLRTGDPHIFAAGDCCAFPLYGKGGKLIRLESWQAAGEQGHMAGQNMVQAETGDLVSCDLVPWFWSEQYDHILQVAGMPVIEDTLTARVYSADHQICFGTDSQGKLNSVSGIAPGTKIAKDIRFSMKLIQSGQAVSMADLADPDRNIKSLITRKP